MKKLILVCLIIFIYSTSYSQLGWFIQNSGTTSQFCSIKFFNSSTAWAVGWNQNIFKTTNGGSNWIPIYSGNNTTYQSVHFVNNNVGYAVGDNGLVMKTTDGGEVWKHYKGKLKEFFVSLFFIDENTGWITGGKYENDSYSGGIYKTENGGDDWNKVYENEGGFVNSIYMKSKDEGMAVCDEGKVLVLQNGAVKDIKQIPSARDLFCVYFANPNKAYVVGCKGVIYFSEDNGINWVTIDSGTDKNLYTVFAPVKNVCFISGEKGIFIKK